MTALDAAQLRARAFVMAGVARAYGAPRQLQETNHCLGCGVDADDVGVDGQTGLCDACAERLAPRSAA